MHAGYYKREKENRLLLQIIILFNANYMIGQHLRHNI